MKSRFQSWSDSHETTWAASVEARNLSRGLSMVKNPRPPQHFADSGRHCGQLPVPGATRGEYKGGLLRNLSCRRSISCWSLVALLRRDSSEDLHPGVSVRAEDAERTFNLLASSRPTTLDSYCSTVSPGLTPRVLLPAFAPLTVHFDPSLMWITTLQTQE